MPHLRELVKLHAEAPFAIIGVNTGDAPDDFRKGVEQHGVSWITAYQGETSPIADLFRVSGYPMYYLIDIDGKIVSKGHSADSMDKKIVALIGKAKEAKKKKKSEG